MHPPLTDRIAQFTGKNRLIRYPVAMAGIRGRSGPPGNQNAFRHGLAGIAQRRADGALNATEQSIRGEILSGLLADKGGAAQISTAMRVLAEIILSMCRYWSPSIKPLTVWWPNSHNYCQCVRRIKEQ
jgi:hypothetical protein